MQTDVDTATPTLALDVSVLLTEPACILSGQEELLKSVYRFWVKPGSVRKPNLPGLGTAKLTPMVRFTTAPLPDSCYQVRVKFILPVSPVSPSSFFVSYPIYKPSVLFSP